MTLARAHNASVAGAGFEPEYPLHPHLTVSTERHTTAVYDYRLRTKKPTLQVRYETILLGERIIECAECTIGQIYAPYRKEKTEGAADDFATRRLQSRPRPR